MTDQSLELHTAAIYTLNLSYTGDLGIHVYAGSLSGVFAKGC